MKFFETSSATLGITMSFILFSVEAQNTLKDVSRKETQNESSSAMKLFEDPDDVEVILPVKNSAGIDDGTMALTINKKLVEQYNFTLDQVKASWIEIAADGGKDIVIEGERYEMNMNVATYMSFIGDDGKSKFLINMNHFRELTIKDIENDPSLIPLDPEKINWTLPSRCNLKRILINITSYSIELQLNDIVTTMYKIDEKDRHPDKISHVKNEGLLLSVVNPHTCKTTIEYLVPTSDIGGYRDLLWGLESISPGKIVLVASLRDGASFIGRKGRKALVKMGSFWARFYLYRDSWFSLFVKGGKIVHDVLIPNLGNFNCSGSPLSFQFDTHQLVPKQPYECLSWPSAERWRARKVFCQTHDGFATLCDCDQPFEFTSKESAPQNQTSDTKNYSLAPQQKIIREDILLIDNGYFEETAQLAFILGIKLLVHKPEGNGSAIISMNLRFALFQGLRLFPEAKSFIVLEDDLILSSDFYSYMNQMAPIFKMDKSIYAVSAFNHLSYPHTSGDPTLTYRVKCYPAYGWMMPRYVIEEILPLWLPSNISHDWDYFVGSAIVRRERECVVPDINRSYHWSTKGFHNRASYMAESLYLSRDLNKDSDAILQPLDRLLKDNYEKEMIGLLKESIPVDFRENDDLKQVVTPGKTYAVYVSQEKTHNDSSFRLFAAEMGIWTVDMRDHFNYAWRFLYKNATVVVVGVPLSPYSSFMPEGQPVLLGNHDTDQEINNGEFFYRAFHKFYTHSNFFYLPTWEE